MFAKEGWHSTKSYLEGLHISNKACREGWSEGLLIYQEGTKLFIKDQS